MLKDEVVVVRLLIAWVVFSQALLLTSITSSHPYAGVSCTDFVQVILSASHMCDLVTLYSNNFVSFELHTKHLPVTKHGQEKADALER